ncbi:MAG: proprotein convertase P-domain-containing protein, partial [Bradymonadaceae bacterium]
FDSFGRLNYYPNDYQPEESLTNLHGGSANGNWKLYVADKDDSGGLVDATLHAWSLAVACN